MAGQTLTFTLEGRDRLSRILDGAGNSAGKLEAKLALASAAIPAAAALAPLIAHTGAAAVAVAAFGAAVIPQVMALGDASKAQKKYEQAVEQSGARSKEAVAAQVASTRELAKLQPETRKAAMGLSVLTGQYKDWSNATARDTMPAVNKGFAVMGGLLPKLTPMVRGVGTELDRTMTLAAGGMATPGFDRVTAKFAAFANGSLKSANDGLVHLSRTLDTGKVGSGFSEFMDFARQQGPLVGETLRNIALAALNVLEAASSTGVGVLQLANALAKVVGSLPPEFLTLLFQTALAIRAVKLGIMGWQLAAGAVLLVRTQITAMGTAALGSATTMGSLRLALMAMSRAARIAVASTGIGLLIVGLMQLSEIGKKTPPDVDKLQSSLAKLGQTGRVSGEAAKAYGKDLSGLSDAVRVMTRPSTMQALDQWFAKFTWDAPELKEAKQDIDAVDKALAGMVQSGQADLAAAAHSRLATAMKKQGMTGAELDSQLGDYKSALADAAFEQKLAADSMGLFGTQAQAASAKLAEQKASADGLRQAITALNDVQRAGLGGMIGFEASIDAAAKAAKDNAGALHMVNGVLNLNSEKARNGASALQDLASKTDEAAGSARESGASWETVNGIYDRGRKKLVEAATQMGLTKAQAAALAKQYGAIPDSKTTRVEMRTEDAVQGLDSVISAIKRTPGAKSVTVKALTADAKSMLVSLGYTVKTMKDGSFKISAITGGAKANVAAIQRARDGLKDKSITLSARDQASATARAIQAAIARIQGKTVTVHTINMSSTVARNAANYRAAGGPIHRAAGGPVGFPGGGPVSGPGTSTSDSIAAFLSDNEYVIKASSVAKYGRGFMDAVNEGRLNLAAAPGAGAMSGAGVDAGRGLASGLMSSLAPVEKASRAMASAVETGIRAELEIASPSKKTKALASDVGAGFIVGLTGSKAKIASMSKDLVKDIWAAWAGSRSTKDSSLVAKVNRDTKKLQDLATKRDKLAATIATAKKYETELRDNARSGAQLSSLGLQPEEVSAGTIKGGLAAKLAEIRTFSDRIYALSKKGLNKGLLRQILNMGPEAGGAYASALMGADKGTFASINSLQSQLDASTATLGRVGADAMYDSGSQAGKGFLVGLTSQQKAIEKQMLTIAKGMQSAIKKALGIKSPSRVMAELGRYSTEGLAVGLGERMPVLDQALAAVSDRVAGTRPVMGAAAIPAGTGAAGGGGGAVINITVQGAIDPMATARQIQALLLKLRREQGWNVSLGLGA
jgi:chorismate mutase